jgi:hypothetical protein
MLGDVDTISLHCRIFMWVKGPHSCRQVREVLDEADVAHELAES